MVEKGENLSHYMKRFMGAKDAEGTHAKQRAAVALSMFKKRKGKKA